MYYIFCHAYLEVLLLRNVFRITLRLQPCDPRKSPTSLVVVVFISSYKDFEEHFHLVEPGELKWKLVYLSSRDLERKIQSYY